MKEFGICGAFDFQEKYTGGQSVKTREFYYALADTIGKKEIEILESTGYKKHPLTFLWQFICLMKECQNVIVFPANKGVKVFSPLCRITKRIFHTKTYYNVIGGWLAKITDENPKLIHHLQSFDSILVETNIMKAELAERGITNVIRLANFKRIQPIAQNNIKESSFPIKLCYFSRVTKLKGIADAVHVVNRINKSGVRCTFDIYGPVADGYNEEFEDLKKEFGEWITYKGTIAPIESVNTVAQYDIQLLPTHYKTEGIPGSILDSYFAGVPVVAARWNSFSDIVIDGCTGVGYDIENEESLYRVLSDLIENKAKINEMKHMALRESKKYMPESVIAEFLQIVRG